MKRIISILCISSAALFLASCGQDSSSSSDKDASISDRESQQQLRVGEPNKWNYPTSQLPENLRLVTQSMGELRVQVGKSTYEIPKDVRPWSGWWFPKKETTLYMDANAPLKKYDQLAKAITGQPSSVSDKFKAKGESTETLSWEGLCDAWSLASVYENEPKSYVVVDNVCLTPGDQKALLTLAYKDNGGHLKNNYFGQLNTKGPQTIYNDIYPDQLHRFIQVELAQRKSPFLMDFEAGESIWTVPVYKAELTITKNPENSERLDVELFLTSPEFQLNEEQKQLNETGELGYLFTKRKYTYSLYGSWQGNEFVVVRGFWTGSSENNHPDYVISLPSSGMDKAPELNDPTKVSYETLRKIFSKAKIVDFCGK